MEPNVSKKLLNVKGQLSANRNKTDLKEDPVQRDLGLLISNLNCTENCEIWIPKPTGAIFQIKHNISNKSSISTKLHAYAGYVVPILTYCSESWYGCKTNLSKFESLQIEETKWIVNGHVSGYKERLLKLKLLPLPLSMYAEMHDLLLLTSLDRNEYDVEIENMRRKNESNTRQNSKVEFEIKNNRLAKAGENFLHGTKHLYNIVSRVYRNYGEVLKKQTITNIYWEYFTNCFDQLNKCTWRIMCKWGTCNNLKKINWNRLINTGIGTLGAIARSLYYYYIGVVMTCCPRV